MSQVDAYSIHGHEVMNMIAEAKPPYTRETLTQAVNEGFGEDVKFHTCAAKDLDLNGLLKFLADRDKLFEKDGNLFTDLGKMCDH